MKKLLVLTFALGSFRWHSAHSYKQYKQGCQRCETECLPVFMWVNEHRNEDDDETDEDDEHDHVDKPPHDSARCEACRLGVCDMMNR